MKKERLYFSQLYAHSKLAFLLVIAYVVITCYQALKSREEFPFLLYGMYSLPETKKQTHTTYEIMIDGKQVVYSELWDTQREIIQTPLSTYAPLIANGQINEAQVAEYKSWLYKYCADMRMTENNVMQVYQLDCRYLSNGRPFVNQKKLLFVYDDHQP